MVEVQQLSLAKGCCKKPLTPLTPAWWRSVHNVLGGAQGMWTCITEFV